jgi:uncharacterized membrane protein YhfC
MILLPMVLWSRLIKRLGLSRHGWATVGYGCLFFILSQIVEAPLRIGVVAVLGAAPSLLGGWLFSLVAGLGEESMRYVAMRWVGQIRERLDRPTAVVYGLGHGGFESLALGLGVLATAFLIRDAFNPATANVPEALAAQARVVAESSPLLFFGGVLERILAIVLHVGLSLIVMRAVLTRSIAYLGLAIAAHTVANGVAVTLQSTGVSGLLIEAWVALAAAAALYYGLRAPEGETSARS